MSLRQLLSKDKKNKQDIELVKFVILKFGYKPKNLALFREALTHKSILVDVQNKTSNERLEYLGDAILDAVIADYIFERFPDKEEGFMTKLKSKIVSRKTLGQLGEQLDIIQHIQYKKGRSINTKTLQGNAFESLIGAIYLDSDFETVRKSVLFHLMRYYINLNQILNEEVDFKSKLLIWTQKNKLNLDFEIFNEENIGAEWKYEVKVIIGEKEWGKGTGTSKKMAEQMASKETLILLGEL